MPKSSMYVRPTVSSGVVLQPRDRAVLQHVARHRYLTSDHIHELAFPEQSLRAVLRRLRKLWEHRYVDRYFLPIVLAGTGVRQNNRPLYTLATLGAEVVSTDTGVPVAGIPQTPERNAAGFATLSHNLVVTDLLVSLDVACRGRDDVRLVSIAREDVMRAAIAARYPFGSRREPTIVSDGSFVLSYPDGRTCTFHVEVVRADVRGGNATLRAKFEKYAALNRSGFFARLYGQPPLRAVLICTTSESRVENLRKLAASLPHGRQLFWFTAYGSEKVVGVPLPAFRSTTVLGPIWRTAGEGPPLSLASGRSASSTAPNVPPVHSFISLSHAV